VNTYKRRGRGQQELVEAIQVTRPYRRVKHAFPRSHLKSRPSGRLDYIRLVDAVEGANRAREGDWIVRREAGVVEVMPAEQFDAEFRPA